MADPLFGHRGRDETTQQLVARLWDAPAPNPFIGGRQPLAPRKFPPSLLSVDSPPAYAWELINFEPEDRTAYFRAQKWPRQKIIVSVDNPPSQGDDEQADSLQIIYGIWNLPNPPLPQRPRYLVPAGQSASGNLTSSSVATAIFSGATLATGALSGVGTSTASWIGTSVANAVQKAAFQLHILRAWDLPASIPQRGRSLPQVSAAAASGSLFSAGSALATFVGADRASAAFQSSGVGFATLSGASKASDPWSAVGTSTVAWVGNALSPTFASGSMSSVGIASAKFVGKSKGAKAANLDGWRVRARQTEQRHRKDEKEIMFITQAVLPLLRRGVRQTTRIDM